MNKEIIRKLSTTPLFPYFSLLLYNKSNTSIIFVYYIVLHKDNEYFMSVQRKVWAISLPPKMEKEIGQMAKREEKTKSELIREALRLYQEIKKKKGK